jgi:hypothetical protein
MSKSLLQICQEFAARTGIPQPTLVVGNADKGVLQMLGLLNELCEDLLIRKAFQQNSREATFVSTAAEDQGNIYTLAPYGFEGIIPETIFDRTQRLPLTGGLTPQEWQVNKSLQNLGPYYQFRIRNDRLLFQPALPVSHTIAFEYVSSFFVASSGGTPQQYWQADGDTFVFPDSIPLSWLRWAWKKEKGVEYAEDFTKYELLVTTKANRDNAPKRVYLDSELADGMKPGILVPQGNWLR